MNANALSHNLIERMIRQFRETLDGSESDIEILEMIQNDFDNIAGMECVCEAKRGRLAIDILKAVRNR